MARVIIFYICLTFFCTNLIAQTCCNVSSPAAVFDSKGVNQNGQFNPYSMVPKIAVANDEFFKTQVSAGDVNGDGAVDYMVASPSHDGVLPVKGIDLGVFFLFY